MHGFRLLRSWHEFGLLPCYPSWTVYQRLLRKPSAYRIVDHIDAVRDIGMVEIEGHRVAWHGGLYRLIQDAQGMLELNRLGRWPWASYGSTLVSMRAVVGFLLGRLWEYPVAQPPPSPPPLSPPHSPVRTIPPHDPDWRPQPLSEDDPELYARFLQRIHDPV